MRKYVEVKCKGCFKEYQKRADSIKEWGGRCNTCAQIEIASYPEEKERRSVRAVIQALRRGGVPNAKKFDGSLAGDKHYNWKGGKPKCIDCGKQLSVRGILRCLKCVRLLYRGENNHNWKGGISGKNSRARHSKKYNQWRLLVYKRDFYTCQECGEKNIEIVAHHIKSFSEFKDLRFNVNNGRTLCRACHARLHGLKLT